MCRAERERARAQQLSISNKLFTFEGTDDSGSPVYSPAPQVQQVCQVVDGFIYVANAEPGRGKRKEGSICCFMHAVFCDIFALKSMSLIGEGESEVAQIRAVLSSAEGSASRPLLVLSCVSREEPEATSLQTIPSRNRARCRTPCVYMAKRLGLPKLANPWMVIVDQLKGFH